MLIYFNPDKSVYALLSGFSLLINQKFNFLAAESRIFVFPATGASEKLLVSEKPLNKRLFKGTGVVLAGIECSPKIFDFRANGILVQESVDFFDTLNPDKSVYTILSGLFLIGMRRKHSKNYFNYPRRCHCQYPALH